MAARASRRTERAVRPHASPSNNPRRLSFHPGAPPHGRPRCRISRNICHVFRIAVRAAASHVTGFISS
jgi:hypothetical protein